MGGGGGWGCIAGLQRALVPGASAGRHTTEPLEVERWMERIRMARVFSRSWRMSE